MSCGSVQKCQKHIQVFILVQISVLEMFTVYIDLDILIYIFKEKVSGIFIIYNNIINVTKEQSEVLFISSRLHPIVSFILK